MAQLGAEAAGEGGVEVAPGALAGEQVELARGGGGPELVEKVREVEVMHLPRIAGEQSGANLKVVAKAFKELFALYGELRSERRGR